MKKTAKKGFTLVELMVVIVIIGILAALAIPRFLGASSKAKFGEFKPLLKQVYSLQEAYKQEADAYGTATAIGFETPNSKYFTITVASPAVPAAGVNVSLATAVPSGQGLKIKIPSSGALIAATDYACVNDVGTQLVATAGAKELVGAGIATATTIGTCTP
jgi:prepilin-type N-terminal cleavage/methylation domain-containing protein